MSGEFIIDYELQQFVLCWCTDRQKVELGSVTLGLYDAVVFQTSVGAASVIVSLSMLLVSLLIAFTT